MKHRDSNFGEKKKVREDEYFPEECNITFTLSEPKIKKVKVKKDKKIKGSMKKSRGISKYKLKKNQVQYSKLEGPAVEAFVKELELQREEKKASAANYVPYHGPLDIVLNDVRPVSCD